MENVVMSAALVTAVNAGVFLAFSDFIMPSFRRAGATTGREAMQAINTRILRSVFVIMLMAMGPIGLALAWWGWVNGAPLVVAGGLIYAFGVVGVTAFGNVPMNNRLDRGADAADYWPTYLRIWTRWNHLRTSANIVAAVALALGALHIA